jgi:transposase
MLPQLPAAVRVFLCTRSTDMRKSFDGLSGLVQECFGQDLLTGHLFLFLNRRRDRIKMLFFDRDGLVIWYKRLEAGSFEMPSTAEPDGVELQPAQLAMILSGIDMRSARQRKRFQFAGGIPENRGETRPTGLA